VHAVPHLRAAAGAGFGDRLAVGGREPAIRVGLDVIDAAIVSHIGLETIVYAPAGVGGHADHQDVAR
jgi:hypothetical protein